MYFCKYKLNAIADKKYPQQHIFPTKLLLKRLPNPLLDGKSQFSCCRSHLTGGPGERC